MTRGETPDVGTVPEEAFSLDWDAAGAAADVRDHDRAREVLVRKRDGLIRRLHESGRPLRQIATTVQMSHPGVKKIIEREET